MPISLPRIYPITDRAVSGLSHTEQVKRLIEGGATFIQLRDKDGAPKSFLQDAEAAIIVARQNDVRIVINDRVDVAMTLGADGVHLGQSDIPVDAARRLLGADAIIGFSTHTISQVQIAATLAVDYVAFGPVFDTRTKRDHEPLVGLEHLREVKRALADTTLVAIGGISAVNFRSALVAGADSVAVISDLLKEPNKISEKLKRMLTASSD
jgi:thiamine-phosphate pyrophosphorylase